MHLDWTPCQFPFAALHPAQTCLIRPLCPLFRHGFLFFSARIFLLSFIFWKRSYFLYSVRFAPVRLSLCISGSLFFLWCFWIAFLYCVWCNVELVQAIMHLCQPFVLFLVVTSQRSVCCAIAFCTVYILRVIYMKEINTFMKYTDKVHYLIVRCSSYLINIWDQFQ